MARYLTLRSGIRMPSLGLGTYGAHGDKAMEAVDCALATGYRHIDTASSYDNESCIGQVLEDRFKAGKTKRKDVFITTKIPSLYLGSDSAKVCVEQSLDYLKLQYLDMLLIHQPWGRKNIVDGNLTPTNSAGERELENYDLCETWKAMESLFKAGRVHSIGLSNCSVRLIDLIWNYSQLKPTNLQLECHIYLQQYNIVNYCVRKGIAVTAYSPLGAPSYGKRDPEDPVPLQEKLVLEIAKRHRKTPAQILLRNLIQREMCVLPKSSTKSRIIENSHIFDFQLSTDEMETLKTLNRNLKFYKFLWAKSHPLFQEGEEF